MASTNITSNFSGANYKCDSWSNEQYPLFKMIEYYVPLHAINKPIWESHIDKLAKLVLDSGEKFTLKTGDKLDLGQGYSLTAKQVDVDGKKVWLEFDKDGQYVDDQIVAIDNWSDKTWTLDLDKIQGENNVVVLKVHVKEVFQGAVDSIAIIDGLWLIDYANIITLKIGDKFGDLTLTKIVSGVDASNPGSLVFDIPHSEPITSIEVISPNSSETWQAGTIQEIKWKYTGNPGDKVKIEWLKGDGSHDTINNPTFISGDGINSFDWFLPMNLIPGNDYKVRITNTKNSAFSNTSENFTISSP